MAESLTFFGIAAQVCASIQLMTDRERWEEIDRLFAAALEREPSQRAAFLETACAGDDALRQEVESLIEHDSHETLQSAKAIGEVTRLLSESTAVAKDESIGPFKVLRTLGIGGMGQVYLAHDDRLNRPVAIKVLSGVHAVNDDLTARFRREALAASALNHPNILTIYEIGTYSGKDFIATEFVEGMTLAEKIEAGPLTIKDSLNITIQAASALAAAHAAGIIHRDVKPANLMIRSDGLVKVLDFGIAKYEAQNEIVANKPVVETTPGSVIGTAAYMSPEQARGLTVDARSDIWSLGVVFYEMLTGCRPFTGDTTIDVMSAVIDREPPTFATHGLSVTAFLEQIVFKSLRKDKNDRYQTANEWLIDLKDFQREIELEKERATKQIKPTSNSSSVSVDQGPNITGALPASPGLSGSKDSKSGRNIDDGIIEAGQLTVTPKGGSETGSEGVLQTRRAPTKSSQWFLLVVLGLSILLAIVFGYRFLGRKHGPIESIAVLPFKNDSGNSEVDYLSDGMTDSLINSLSQLPNLSVKARSSVFQYKGLDVDAQRVATSLSVQAVLTGRVVQHGDDLTLYLSLVDPAGNQIWGTQYDRKLADLLILQREMAHDVSQSVRVKLSGADEQKLAKDYTANAEAYQLYLKGRFHVFKLTPAEVQQGISNFQQAIQLDPGYALAYVGLSEAYRSLALGSEMEPNEFLPRAKATAQKALEIDEALSEAHTAYGASIFWYDHDWVGAENQYKRALELNPNNVDAHVFYSHLCSNIGRHDQALAEIKRARELDPVSPFVSALQGQFQLHAGKTDEALATLKETFSLAPNFWFPHVFASSAYIEKGMYTEALDEARRAMELAGTQTVGNTLEIYALAKAGRLDEARGQLEALLNLSKTRYVPPYHIALAYNGIGETDESLAWLDRSITGRDPKINFLKVEPKWKNLHSDPRFQKLLARIGFNP